MRTEIIIKCILTSFIVFGFASCGKYLDHNPDMRAELNTEDKIGRLITSSYVYRNYLAMAETYSDNVEDKGVGNLDEPLRSFYYWEDVTDDDTNTPTDYWNACYRAIAAANQALEAIEEEEFDKSILPFKGEALVSRAYAHFMLSIFFAKTYKINGDNSSPGIPYVEEPETVVFKDYDRGTVEEVYNKIRRDLEEGIPLLAGGKWDVPKYHFTPASANAFAARFYLFTGEWDKAIKSANAVFPGGDYTGNLRPFNSKFKEIPFAEMNVIFSKADQPYNLLLAETYSTYQRFTSSRYAMGVDIYQNVYNGKTAAGEAFYNYGSSYGSPHYTTYQWREYFHYTNPAAAIGYPYLMFPLLTTDETLLNRAEAYIQVGDYGKALDDLNLFAANRVNNYNPSNHQVTIAKSMAHFDVADDKQALIETVLEFKRISFLQEGIRWFDILRHELEVKHNVLDEAGKETFITLSKDDPRRIFQIPQEASLSNVEPNPR